MKLYLRAQIFAGLVMLPGCAAMFDPATYAFLREPLWTTPASSAVAASNEDHSRDTDRRAAPSRDRDNDGGAADTGGTAPSSSASSSDGPTSDGDGGASDTGGASSSSSSSSSTSSDGPTSSGGSMPSDSDDDDVPNIPSLPAGPDIGSLGGGIDPVGIDPGGPFNGLQLR